MDRKSDSFRNLPEDLTEQLPHTPPCPLSIKGHDRGESPTHIGVTSATEIAGPGIIAGDHKGLVVKRSDETPAQGSQHITNGLSHIGIDPQALSSQTFVY